MSAMSPNIVPPKNRMSVRLPHWGWFLMPAVVLLIASIAAFLWWSVVGRDHVWQTGFDSAGWKRADPIEGHRTVRSKMIEDLLHKNDFHGWTRQRVEQLLGPPEEGEGKAYGFPQFDKIYMLGLERGGAFSLDDEALGFRYDGDGKVAAFGVSVN